MEDLPEQSVIERRAEIPALPLRARLVSAGRYATAVLTASATLGVLAPATAVSAENDDQNTTPHLAFGIEDDVAISSNNSHQVNIAAVRAHDIGAGEWREIIYPRDVLRGRWHKYDLGIHAASARGLDVYVTLACNGINWTDRLFQRYMRLATKHLNAENVHDEGVCDEPNGKGGLNPMPGKTIPQTYRQLYQEDGYPIIEQQAAEDGTTDEVSIGELNSAGEPLRFMRAVAACPPSTITATCPPLITYGYAYHPYQRNSPLQPSSTPGEDGIGLLAPVQTEIDREFQAGEIETPDDQDPDLELTEFAYLVNNQPWRVAQHRRERKLYLPERTIVRYALQALAVVCADPRVSMYIWYGESSPSKAWPGYWNSSLYLHGKPDNSELAMRWYVHTHPQCIEAPNTGTTKSTTPTHYVFNGVGAALTATSSSGRARRQSTAQAAS